MKRSFASMMVIASFALLLVGCQSGKTGNDGFRMPGVPRTPAMPGGSASAMPGAASSPMPASGQNSSGQSHSGILTSGHAAVAANHGQIAQVGYLQGGAPIPMGPVLQGQPIRRALKLGNCSCCNSDSGEHQSINQPTNSSFDVWGSQAVVNTACAPHGYVEFSPEGWNLYGSDPQEFICDGGDHPPEARVLRDDSIDGLQPEDTVVHYTSEAGDISIQASNRTCVYSPRFASVRKITEAIAGERAITLNTVDRPVGASRVEMDLPGLVVRDSIELGNADVARRIDALRDRNRGVRVEGDVAPIQQSKVLEMMTTLAALETGQLGEDQKAIVQRGANAAIAWTISESVEVAIEDLKAPVLTRDQSLDAFTVYDFPDAGRLRIVKMADKQHAQSGEEVEFAIRVQNVGDSPVNNVVITDNLVGRLMYVEDSQSSDGEVEFSQHDNSTRSLRLEWKLKSELKVGESVLIQFRCKLR